MGHHLPRIAFRDGSLALSTMFVGSQCALCTDPNWNVQEKNL
jgi:hypothetical protein